MEQLGMTIGYAVLLTALGGILYAFGKLLKFAFSAIKDNDD
jgi:hypothetical protein